MSFYFKLLFWIPKDFQRNYLLFEANKTFLYLQKNPLFLIKRSITEGMFRVIKFTLPSSISQVTMAAEKLKNNYSLCALGYFQTIGTKFINRTAHEFFY